MADVIFNANRHLLGHYLSLPATDDGLVFIPIEAAGVPTDAVLADADTLAAVVTAGAVEQTIMGRLMLDASTVTVDDDTDTTSIDVADLTWTAADGDPTGKLLCCYDPDTTTGTDADLAVLVAFDFTATPDGTTDVTGRVDVAGLVGFA